MGYNYDLIVIGAGSGGSAAAKRAASYGAKVAIVERDKVGGTCVNRGCIASELLSTTARFARSFADATNYGWQINGSDVAPTAKFDWQHYNAAKDAHLEHLIQTQTQALTNAGVKLVRGQAAFVDAHTIVVNDQKISATKILIAVGGKPNKPEGIPGIEYTVTSREVFYLEEQPKNLLVMGGGYIGTSIADCFNKLGTRVTLVDANERILAGWDDDLCQSLHESVVAAGVQIFSQTKVKSIEKTDHLRVTLTDDSSSQLAVDAVLCAIGRSSCTKELELKQAGVELDEKGKIIVDASSRTNQPHIFAVGDCASKIELTPVAIAEAQAFADSQFGDRPHQINHEMIPAYIATQPQLAAIGLTETQAREQYGDAVQCYRKEFQPLYYSLTDRKQKALVKLVTNSDDSDRIIGAHMIGDHAADIIQSLGVAIRMGATKQDFERMIGIHPTIAEEFLKF